MVFVRIREAKEEDCGNILRLIRVKFAGQKTGSQRGSERRGWRGPGGGRGCGGGGSREEEVGAEGGVRPGVYSRSCGALRR